MSQKFSIAALDRNLVPTLQSKIDQKTKPLGALGQLEQLALQIGLIQQTIDPQLKNPTILVFAADHGIAESAVSPYPQAVTYQMVLNFLAGGAAINVFARQNALALNIIDAGVNADFAASDGLINAKIAKGTANFLHGPAMTLEQCQTAVQRGSDIARQTLASGCNALGFGEMGIANTSSATALMSVLCDLPVAVCVGRGTGLDDAGLQRKQQIIEQALAHHALNAAQPLAVLAAVGGFEIAMMVGAMLAAAQARAVLLIDGFIASVALLVASRLQPSVLDYAVFCHCSNEAGHRLLLDQLNAQPLLNLDMRLGEGSACALAYPLLQSAVLFLNQMASFEAAGVSQST